MRHRTTFVLMTLFLAGLGLLWWADYAEVPTRARQRELLNRLLPALVDVKPGDVARVEVDRDGGKSRFAVERRGPGRWQVVEPLDAAADPTLVETLVNNLKELRKSPDAGTITGDPARFGLATPAATVRLYGGDGSKPLATLEVGSRVRERAYVRPDGDPGIEVVDARPLDLLGKDAAGWRDAAIFRVPSFRVASVDVRDAGPSPGIRLERDDRRWRLVRPLKTPADNDKVEGLVAELAALRVEDGASGFVEDDAKDLGKYGLDTPSATIEVTPFADSGAPQTVKLGKPVPDKPNQVYAMRGDQNDVVRLDVKRLREAIPGANGLRSPTVLDLSPQRVNRVRVDAQGKAFDLARSSDGWEILSPVREPADVRLVQRLLANLADLKASEFLAPSAVADPKLDRPTFRVRAWQPAPGSGSAKGSASGDLPEGEPQIDLALGRLDALRKTIYGRIAGDPTVLALPDLILDDLPRNDFAYRDLTVLGIKPESFARVSVDKGAKSVTVRAPTAGEPPGRWRVVEPVRAPADDQAVTMLLLAVGSLRADAWESDSVGDGKAFGLDAPRVRVSWVLTPGGRVSRDAPEGGTKGALRVGAPKPGKEAYYANVEGDPRVFSVPRALVVPMEGELRARGVFGLPAKKVEGVTFRWPSRSVAVERAAAGEGPGAWRVAPGYDPSGFDPSRVGPFVAALADLRAIAFRQYDGPIPPDDGLGVPRLAVSFRVEGEPAERTLRFGNARTPHSLLATTAPGPVGPVFEVAADAAVVDLFRAPRRPEDLPDDPFAPAPVAAPAPTPGRR